MSIIKKIVLSLCIWSFAFVEIWAQCPMCKAAAESNLKEGGTAAMGLNQGIIYLFLTPFCIAGTLIVLWFWFNRKKADELETEEIPMEHLSESS